MRTLLAVALALAAGSEALADSPRDKPWTVELETGAVWPARNVARIPGDTGTWFRLNDLTGSGARTAWRLTLTRDIGGRQELRLLAAPLSISGTGTPASDIRFRDTVFQAGVPTQASYEFNSYRLTWRRDAGTHGGWKLKWGATLKIRDARTALKQGSVEESEENLGLVPLLHGSAERSIGAGWRVAADLDALAAPQGRAEDLSVRLVRDLPGDAWVSLGYRTLEGGADNDRVYTFAWLNYLTASVGMRF